MRRATSPERSGRRSRRAARALAAGLVSALVAVVTVGSTQAAAPVRRAPSGLRFYAPPHRVYAGKHGSLVWARPAGKGASIPGASRNELVLYRSRSVSGRPVVVSGVVSLPKGKAPRGGWPVVSYAHATTGIADVCAPSRVPPSGPGAGFTAYVYPMLSGWLERGWAVVRTDYEGLGTPGAHPYLVGASEGRSTLDIVRAARAYSSRLSRTVAIAGHSQGGHAALWAARLAASWTPELRVRATVAFAPASHLATEGRAFASRASTAFSGLVALIVRGYDTAYPSLDMPGRLSARARPRYPQTLHRCVLGLHRPDSFGSVPADQILRSPADYDGLIERLGQNDPENLRLRSPVRIEQGTSDTTVFPAFTAALVSEYRAHGNRVSSRTYRGVTHAGIVSAARSDATSYIARALR